MAPGLQERPSVCLVSGSVSRGCLCRTGDLASVKGARPEGTAHPAAHTAVLPARAAWPRGLASVTALARSAPGCTALLRDRMCRPWERGRLRDGSGKGTRLRPQEECWPCWDPVPTLPHRTRWVLLPGEAGRAQWGNLNSDQREPGI